MRRTVQTRTGKHRERSILPPAASAFGGARLLPQKVLCTFWGPRKGAGRELKAVSDVSEELTFEAAQAELERIVDRLESGRAELDEAIALWESGEELYRVCRKKLDLAEGRIEELAQRVEGVRKDNEPPPFTGDPPSA